MYQSTIRPRKTVPKKLFYAYQLPRLESAAQWREFGSMVPDHEDVFIAYLPEDTATIRQLDDGILAEGFQPGVGDPASLLGVREDGQIEPGILACDAFLLFVGRGDVIPEDLKDELAQAQALNKLIIFVATQPLLTSDLTLEPLTWQIVNLEETIRVLKALARTVVHCLTYVRLQARALTWQAAPTDRDKIRLLLSAGDLHATVAKVNWIEAHLGADFAITPAQRAFIQASQAALGPRPGKGYVFGSAPDIFISYSSKNRDFVRLLYQSLREKGFHLWVDWENIPIAADWTEEVADGIIAAHTFIFVISSDSLVSEHCHWELDQARAYNRRLIPICCDTVIDSERLDRLGLSKLNYCQFAPLQSEGRLNPEALDMLLERLRTDLEDAKQYNKLFTKAYEWDTQHRPETQLMASAEYKLYEHWIQTRQANNRHIQLKDLHPLQQDYLQASHQAILRQVARRRTQTVGGLAVVVGTLILFTSVAISARIGELNALIESLTEQKGLNGLITALKASKQLKQTPLVGQQQNLRLRTITALHGETLNVREVNKFSSNQWGLFDVAFSPDSSHLVSVGEDGAVRAWSANGSRAYVLPEGLDRHSDTVVAVDYSSDGNFFASGGYDGKVNLWSCVNPGPPGEVPNSPQKPPAARLPRRSGYGAEPIPQVACRWLQTLPLQHGKPQGQADSAPRPETRIARIGISPGSQYLASAGFDGQVLLWQRSRAPNQQIVFPDRPKAILRHRRRVYGLDFSPHSQLLATADAGGVIKVWSLIDAAEKAALSLDVPILDVTFSPDGQALAVARNDGTVTLWWWATNQRLDLPAHAQAIAQIKFSPNGQVLASADSGGNLKLWRVGQLRPRPQAFTPAQMNDSSEEGSPLLATLKGHQDHITQLQFSPNGRILASASLDNTVRLWLTADGALLDTIAEHQDQVLSIAFSPLNQSDKSLASAQDAPSLKLASASRDGTLRLWRVNTAVQPLVHENIIFDVAFRPDGQYLASGGKGSIRLWRLSDQSSYRNLGYKSLSTEVYSVDYHPDATTNLIAAGDSRGIITLWQADISSDQPEAFWSAHPESLNVASKGVKVVRFSPSGQYLASGGSDGHLKIWNLAAAHQGNPQPWQDIALGQVITDLSFSQDGTRLVVATEAPVAAAEATPRLPPHGVKGNPSGELKLFAVDSETRLQALAFAIPDQHQHQGDILTVTFHPYRNDEFLAGDAAGTIKIWSTQAGAVPQTLTGHGDGITRVIYSRDCTMLASSSRDKTVKLWRLPTSAGCGQPQDRPYALSSLGPLQPKVPVLMSTLRRHSTQVTKVAFNPTNPLELATSGFDQRVLIWTLPQGLNWDALSTLVQEGCRTTEDFLTMATHPDRFGVSGDSPTQGDNWAAIQAFCAKHW